MSFYIFLALLNGVVIGTSRATNGQLSNGIGPFRASLWNHVIGFLFLTVIVVVIGEWHFDANSTLPISAYFGGFFGALFVAVNSYVFPRLGAMNSTLLVISGQMISAVLIDWLNHNSAPDVLRCLGVVAVLFGIYLTRMSKFSHRKEKKNG
ncbi:MAG: DMT family transporter [Brasilonema angustatum HA4187-MV1]|jgi:transporter family-2 protein|nr:DMT family transporter [Brasilonema angustatum HA4187-MV1]